MIPHAIPSRTVIRLAKQFQAALVVNDIGVVKRAGAHLVTELLREAAIADSPHVIRDEPGAAVKKPSPSRLQHRRMTMRDMLHLVMGGAIE